MRALGLNDSLMYGGYESAPAGGRRPRSRSASRASRASASASTRRRGISRGSRGAVYLAAAGKGPLLALGVSGSEARYLLWLLAQVADRGKLDRFLGGGSVVMHKAGWLPAARHDNGIVAFYGGAYVATVMTWRTGDADELAGQVSLAALQRFGA